MTATDATPATGHTVDDSSEVENDVTRMARLGAWTFEALRDVAYGGAVLLWSVVGFSLVVTGISVTGSLLVLVIGVVVWVAFIHVLRWATWVDRSLAGWRRGEHVAATYRHSPLPGFVPYLRTLTRDPQTWKDMAWLGVNSFVGFGYGVAVVTGVGMVVGYVSMPAWYWAVSHPSTEYGITNLGAFTVDTMVEAAAATAIGLALLPVVLVLARIGASMHSRLAISLLAPASTVHR